MKYPHRYLPDAQQDLFDIVRYYEAQRPGLGGDFLDELEITLRDICEHPRRYATVMRRVRQHKTHRFPYGVVYTIAREKVFVLAIGDLRRRPGWWRDRLKNAPR
jgi:plasmid stabilization system protein ParE